MIKTGEGYFNVTLNAHSLTRHYVLVSELVSVLIDVS